jgi:hypothetical protein
LFKSKTDVLNAILIAFLSALAVVQVRGLILKPGAASLPEPATQAQYTVERAPEIRPEMPPPRTPGRSGIRTARVHLADATN